MDRYSGLARGSSQWREPSRRAKFTALGVAALISFWASPTPPRSVLASEAFLADIQGRIVSQITGEPIANARVRAPDLKLSTSSDSDGRFAWHGIPLAEPALPTTITVSAAGYGDWTIEQVRLLAGDTLLLEAELGPQPTTIVVPPPRATRPAWPELEQAGQLLGIVAAGQMDLPIPSTIRVRVTGWPYCDLSRPYAVQVVDFKQYAKHVLPNEWVASWPWESVRAGAMAVKMYAWSYIAVGGKWSDADVYDSTCDQVYNPAVSYASTNKVVDFTWNWRLTRSTQLVRTFYRAYASQCPSYLAGNCMGQVESRDMAYDGMTWDEILYAFYQDTLLSPVEPPPGGFALRYYGNGYGDLDRVKIQVDDPAGTIPGPPVDVGAEDFTIEWWMRGYPDENTAGPVTCGGDSSWKAGNVLLDRDRFNQARGFGVALAGGRLAFGVRGEASAEMTICSTQSVTHGRWHHVAIQRRSSDGWLWLFLNGALEIEADGPDGDISYPDDGVPASFCGPSGDQPCNSDPYLVIGAEKHDLTGSLSYSGWIDELRLSNVLRYSGNFSPPSGPFGADANTVALYHFDEGVGNTISDSSGHPDGPSPGVRKYGGVVNGPEWTTETPFGPTFTDVPFGMWAYDQIDAIYQAGITGGCQRDPLMFCPQGLVTRAQMAIFILRGLNSPGYTPPPATGIFADVDPAHWTAAWIEDLYSLGITFGCGTDPLRYCPNSYVTRTQMAVFLVRAVHGSAFVPPPAVGIFSDVPRDGFFDAFIEQAHNDGITLGCATSPLRYCPTGLVSRGEMAVFLARAFDLPLP